MDLKDGLVLCSFCLVLTTAYFYHSILVLQDEVKRHRSTIDLLTTSKENTVDELHQQKLSLDELKNKFLNFIDGNSEVEEMVVSIKHKVKSIEYKIQPLEETDIEDTEIRLVSLTKNVQLTELNIKSMEREMMHTEKNILTMKAENMKQIQELKDTITRLQSYYFDVKEGLVENKGHLIENFGNIFQETRKVYTVIERIHERIHKLEDTVNRRHDTGIISLIKGGISRLVQFGLHFFLGPVAGYIE